MISPHGSPDTVCTHPSHPEVSTSAPEWPDPIPLDHRASLPPFPTDALEPAPLREMVKAVAAAHSVPPDLPALSAIVLASGAAAMRRGQRVVIEPRPGWRETPNLYGLVSLQSGSRKSSALAELLRPFQEFEASLRELAVPVVAESKSRRAILESRLKRAEEEAAKLSSTAEEAAEASSIAAELARTPEPHLPRVLCEDVTPEKLADLLAHHSSLILASPECDLIGMFQGRFTRAGSPDLGIFLKAHSGEGHTVDRIGRSGVRVDHPLLTILMYCQPEALASLMSDARLRDRGLINRFLIATPPSPLGSRPIRTPSIPPAVREEYRCMLLPLLERCFNPPIPPQPDATGNCGGIGGSGEPIRVRFSPEAAALLDDFRAELEPDLAEHGRYGHMSGWVSKLPGAIVRIAGVMSILEHPDTLIVESRTVSNAIRIGRWALAHAEAAFGHGVAIPQLHIAQRALAWLQRHSRSAFTHRDVFQALKAQSGGGVNRSTDLDEPLRILEEHGYIRKRPEEKPLRAGRPPSPVYDTHPSLHPKEPCAPVTV